MAKPQNSAGRAMPRQVPAQAVSSQVRLQAPLGTDEANHGTERFRVDNDGTITVPVEAAPALETVGGFTEIKEPVELPAGKARVAHADAAASCSFAGEAFVPEADGTFLVPIAAVVELAAHGFLPVAEEAIARPASPEA